MRLPGQNPDEKASKIREAARGLALYGAQLSGVPAPPRDAPTATFFEIIRSALDVLSEMQHNASLQASRANDRASADQANWKSTRTTLVLSLASLRHQLRARATGATAAADSVSDLGSVITWVIERLNETLETAGASEFVDVGRLDVTRHHVIGRLPADAKHLDGAIEAYAKLSLKKYSPIAAWNEDRNVFSGLL